MVDLDVVADRDGDVRVPSDPVDLGGLLREGLAAALLLHQREADHAVGAVERRHEPLVHAEREGHEERALAAPAIAA
jgi:hypothetical protein